MGKGYHELKIYRCDNCNFATKDIDTISNHVCKHKGTLSEKIRLYPEGFGTNKKVILKKDVKEKIQNAQKRLKEISSETHDCGEGCEGYGSCNVQESLVIRKDDLEKIFQEEFGKELLE